MGAGSRVTIEDCLINGQFGGSASGIVDNRGSGQLVINNTTVRNMGTNGISIASSAGLALRTVITNTRIINAATGLNAGANASIVLSHSVISSSAVAALTAAASARVNIDTSIFANSTVAFENSANGAVRLSNSEVSFNVTAVNGGITSFVSNRFTDNDSLGGNITPNPVLAR